jgi:hypothetical protein
MTLHFRRLPSRPVRIDTPTDREKRKALHSELRKEIGKLKRRKKFAITYSHS